MHESCLSRPTSAAQPRWPNALRQTI
jgi:hypothetical protein